VKDSRVRTIYTFNRCWGGER